MAGLDSISTLAKVLGNLNPAGKTTPSESVDATQASSGVGKTAASEKVALSRTQPDQATLSSAGGLVLRLSATPDVRTEKVAQLQAAIASGSYKVPAADVANKLVEHLLR